MKKLVMINILTLVIVLIASMSEAGANQRPLSPAESFAEEIMVSAANTPRCDTIQVQHPAMFDHIAELYVTWYATHAAQREVVIYTYNLAKRHSPLMPVDMNWLVWVMQDDFAAQEINRVAIEDALQKLNVVQFNALLSYEDTAMRRHAVSVLNEHLETAALYAISIRVMVLTLQR
jgi:hypothetical protein